jgi:hypothetical protein
MATLEHVRALWAQVNEARTRFERLEAELHKAQCDLAGVHVGDIVQDVLSRKLGVVQSVHVYSIQEPVDRKPGVAVRFLTAKGEPSRAGEKYLCSDGWRHDPEA